MRMDIDIQALRAEVTAVEDAGPAAIFFDNPAGTQIAWRPPAWSMQ